MFVQNGKIRRVHLAREGVAGLDPYAAMMERKVRRIHLSRRGVSGLGQLPGVSADVLQLHLLTPIVAAAYAAREAAAPEIERGYQAAQGGFQPRTQLRIAKGDLEKLLHGIPAGSPGFPDGVPGFYQLAMPILGISEPRQAPNNQPGQLFRKTIADIDWWINRATEAQRKAGAGPSEMAAFQGEVGNTFFAWSDALQRAAPAAVQKVKQAAASAGAAGTNLTKAAESLAKGARSTARQVRKLPTYAKLAIFGGGAIMIGLFGLAALFIATRKR